LAEEIQTVLDFFADKPQTYFCVKCKSVHAVGEHVEGPESIGLTDSHEPGPE
jgi:hypothetical protein